MSDTPRSTRGRGLLFALGFLVLAAGAGYVAMNLSQKTEVATMDGITSEVYQRFPEVEQLAPEDLETRLASAKPPLIIDARTEAEYAVSHIKDAVRVDASAKPDEVVAKVGKEAAGRDVVVYCSVGMRSSTLASSSQDALVKAGATSVSSLVGGVYGWHNAKRPLVDAKGATDFIHPNSPQSGKLLTRQDMVK